MSLLIAISILSFCALFWIALTTARRLRSRRRRAPHAQAFQQPLREIFDAGEVRAPRSLRLLQNLSQYVARQPRVASAQAREPLAFFEAERKAPQSIGHADGTLYNKDLGATQSARTVKVPATGRKVL
jgi:hypothetical protein